MVATAKAPIRGPESLTDEWFTKRNDVIGSSEAAKAVGLSEWSTPLHLYCEKLGLTPPFEGNEHTRRGRRYEPLIAEDWQEITGRKLEAYPSPMFIHSEYPWMAATPDGIINSSEGLEIKCPTWRQRQKFGEQGTDHIPNDYIVQAQHQMAVMGWDVVHFAILIDLGEEPMQHRVDRNEKFIRKIIAAEEELWQRIQDRRPPDPTWTHDRTPELIKAMHGLATGKTAILPASVAAMWKHQAELAEREKAAKEEREVVRAKILHEMGDAAVAIFEAGPEGPIDLEIARIPVKGSTFTVNRNPYVMLKEVKKKG